MPPSRDDAKTAWEREREREWRENMLKNLEELKDGQHDMQLEMAVMKVKFAFVGAALGIGTSVLTTVVAHFLMRSLNLK